MTMTATLDAVARRKKPPTENVRLDKEVARTLRILAAANDTPTPDFLTELLRPILDKQYREFLSAGHRGKPDRKS
jgi:hypothetical protein